MTGEAVSTEAFLPDPRTAENRPDGARETSIDWEDDSEVLHRAFARRDQSAHGIARVSRSEMDRIRRLRSCVDQFSYERHEIDGNPHHGNLLFARTCSKPIEKMIASALALDAELLRRPATE